MSFREFSRLRAQGHPPDVAADVARDIDGACQPSRTALTKDSPRTDAALRSGIGRLDQLGRTASPRLDAGTYHQRGGTPEVVRTDTRGAERLPPDYCGCTVVRDAAGAPVATFQSDAHHPHPGRQVKACMCRVDGRGTRADAADEARERMLQDATVAWRKPMGFTR